MQLRDAAEKRARALRAELLRVAKAVGVKVEYFDHTDPAVDTDAVIASITRLYDELEECHVATSALMDVLGAEYHTDVLPMVKALQARAGGAQ
jgi:hypothetical protein